MVSPAPPAFRNLFLHDQCWHDVGGITYGALTSQYSADQLFDFNKTHGTTYLNYIPDGPVRAHFGGVNTGKTIVWAAFVLEEGGRCCSCLLV